MRKLAMSALFVALLCGSAFAHNGALSLYLNASAGEIGPCSSPISDYGSVDINMYYIRDNGPDLGKAIEFRLEFSPGIGMVLNTVWNTGFTVWMGNLTDGQAATASQCLGANEAVVYLATFTVMDLGSGGSPFTCAIKENPTSQPPAINITICDPAETMAQVLGGVFVFNGSCNPGVSETSWGAIKELYR
jgi:hypothetical protein